ncbi:MAG: ABC transporter ATP-binding protein, partial [Oscillospiraceae bacterium]|nr:ABC transporter ATP-binding protein [Oscillospiraceae bacterium]
MLQIKDIRKKYVTGDLVQTALDGVSLNLRDNEFVAILGPSGSGKTTLLNVIGGLDRYDSGDLIINGISTRKYSDRDWDSYRNHTIGFVFQSYNLIPHQTVLSNVELALTISGISPAERKKRAKKALEDVGLGNQLHKRPNQMSGGQMQRVAIARALVNNPDILLADEPTGALDSETSVQIMDLLQEVAKDRLVVMVTHNPELAEEYANRIVRVKDGKIIDDSNPFVPELSNEPPKHENMGRSSMSMMTALSLSFNNLLTKKARTLLTAFAGSIGIIGIALIMSLSTGFQKYIDKIQEDTLSNYPLSIQSETADMAAMMGAFGSSMAQAAEAPAETVIEQQMITQMFAQIGTNDLASFKAYLDANMDEVDHTINSIKYSYGIKPRIFLADTSETVTQVNPGTLFNQITGSSAMSAYMDSDIFHEMIDNYDMLNSQYQVLKGRWPEAHNELVYVLSHPNQITDYEAYTLGLKDPDTLNQMITQVMSGEEPDFEEASMRWTYDDLLGLTFRLVPASSLYRYNTEYNVWEDMSGDQAYMKELVDQGELLTIVGIVCPQEGVSTTTLSSGICYTQALTEHVIASASESEIVKNQLADENVDVFTGKPFGEEDQGGGLSFEDMISIDGNKLTSAFGMNVNTEDIMRMLKNYIGNISDSMNVDTKPAQQEFTVLLNTMGKQMLAGYITENSTDEGIAVLKMSDIEVVTRNYLAGEDVQAQIAALAVKYGISKNDLTQVYSPLLMTLLTDYIVTNAQPVDPTPDIAVPSEPSEDIQPPEEDLPEEEPAPSEASEAAVAEASEEAAPDEDNANEDTSEGSAFDPAKMFAYISLDQVDGVVDAYTSGPLVTGSAAIMAGKMMQPTVYRILMSKISEFGNVLMGYIGNSFYVDEEMMASAFQFEMDEMELRRLMEAMSGAKKELTAAANLRTLGYADTTEPTAISIY